MQRQSRQIIVMRHAKAEQVGATDRDRELAPRGRDEAARAARWLVDRDIVPTHALVSAAVRTRQTWETVRETAGWPLEATYDAGLYAAMPETVFDLIREAPAQARTLMVVGHNPTMESVAQLLDDGEGDTEVALAMARGFATSAVAVLLHEGEWADVAESSARLVDFFEGR
ncbi:histidine phosphatase family protein [Nocardioides sp.]|uniref:SixA phosphatase family protein n=1 Tax=Nocardioides sp. TaxID=35761 RepID=UPI0035617879